MPDVLQSPAHTRDQQRDDRPSPAVSPPLESLTQTKTDGVAVKDDQSDEDKEVHIEGALSESSEEGDSDDSMILQDLL